MVLTLRARILLFLVLFAATPLFVAVTINLPLVLDRVELFYRHAILQNLRADFRDLDEHLASRDEMVRLLAKLPEPGTVIGNKEKLSDQQIDLARASYARWINNIFDSQLDVVDIVFLDEVGIPRFWLTRDPDSHRWVPSTAEPPLPPIEYSAAALQAKGPVVLPTPLRIHRRGNRQALTLQMLSPVGFDKDGHASGAVAISVDINGLIANNPNTYWVLSNGHYLNAPPGVATTQSAFDTFPGLRQRFAEGRTLLLEQDGRELIWVPLLRMQDGRPLWVGRQVDREPLTELQRTLIIRVLSIIAVLAVIIWLAARWVARNAEVFGSELLNGIRRMLESDEPVTFSWNGTRELRQLGADLSELADSHARTARNLRAHTRELEESNRYKSEFLANVSHELRTPLNSILLLSKLLNDSDETLPNEARERAAVIHKASKDLRSLIDNILDLSRMEAGHHNLHIEEVDLGRLLRDVVALMKPQFEAKQLSLELQLPDQLPPSIHTDADKLRQIVKNFLSNAVKFTHRGGVCVALHCADEPHAVAISVQDDGIGIAKDKQKLIFEAFKQADGAINRRYGGTGLGLAISRHLAQLLGGSIRLESREGQGACFTVLLPADCSETPQVSAEPTPILPTEPQAPPSAPAPSPSALERHKIVVVDDNVRRLLRLTEMLEGWGMTVVVASDEDELLETLDEDPDCALVLFTAPSAGDDSYGRMERLRQQAGNPQLRFAVLAAAAQADGGTDSGNGALPDKQTVYQLLSTRLGETTGETT